MKTWQDCVAFHGHECGGLAIGYKASLLAAKLLGLTFSKDEQVVCISENDSCSVDAVQVMLGCSVGKGNLLFHMRGKQAFSFYCRNTGNSLRLVLKPRPEHIGKEDSLAYYQSLEPEEMFEIKQTTLPLPEKAKIFESYTCCRCGEVTGSRWVIFKDGNPFCLDCCGEER